MGKGAGLVLALIINSNSEKTMKPNLFNSIMVKKPKKNVFDLTHDVKMTMDMGELVPFYIQECVPGDKFKLSCEALVRFAPMLSPVYQRFNAFMHFFFVPNRILWDGWEEWITNPDSTRVHPTFDLSNADLGVGSLTDYLGLPAQVAAIDDLTVSALPFAVYQKIWSDYYRDQNLSTVNPDTAFVLTDGDNTATKAPFIVIRRRCWAHDYLTSALPFAQKGSQVLMPMGEMQDLPVVKKYPDAGTAILTSGWQTTDNPGAVNSTSYTEVRGSTFLDEFGTNQLYVPTSELQQTASNINDLRRAFRLQEFLEALARGGSRYVEYIKSIFGVTSSDARLQRAEYITGIKSPIVISEVLNTSGQNTLDPGDPGLPQGNMAGHGIGVVGGSKYGTKFCEEHGYIMGIMSVMPVASYSQGVPKHFIKYDDQFKHYTPQFANIGEQPVENVEVFADLPNGTEPVDRQGTFGYTPRYAEYKYNQSRIAGNFRNSLDYWHLGREFGTQPQLDEEFVQCDPGKRIFAVVDEDVDSLYVQVLNRVSAVRPMPKFGTPSF